MKEGIHPTYYVTQVSCACGNTFSTRSTKPELRLEICSGCHPFFTGKQKFVDTEGRIDRFAKKLDQAKVHKELVDKKKKTAKKVAAKAAKPIGDKAAKKTKVLSTRPVTKG